MEKRTFLTLLLLAATVTSAGWAWLEGSQRRKEVEAASFDRRRLELIEQENERLRNILGMAEREAFEEKQAAARKEIEATTSQLRGLEFLKPVDYQTLARKDVKAVIQRKINEQYSEAEFEAIRRGYVALGLLPEGFDLKQTYIDLLGEQIAAFYDQHTHQLFMFDDVALDNAQNRVILSHELVHALQDQHFTLRNLPLELKNNDDRVIATTALLEGDATMIMNDFMMGEASMKTVLDTATALLGQNYEQLQKAPRLLRDTLIFPYLDGLKFCMALQERRGSEGVNEAYKRLPTSSTQILHPEKYFANEEPLPVLWENLTWNQLQPMADNVLGELGTRILLQEWSEEALGRVAAQGWRGDRYLIFEVNPKAQKESAKMALVWRSIWQGPMEQSRFANTAKAMWAKRYGAKVVDPESDLPTQRVRFEEVRDGRELRMALLPGHEVLLIDAPDAASADGLLEAFGKPATR